MNIKTEAGLQRWFIRELRRAGCVVYKFASPSNRGVPDLLIVPFNRPTCYVELKSPTGKGKLSELQKHHIGILRAQGAKVWVSSSQEDCRKILKEIEEGV